MTGLVREGGLNIDNPRGLQVQSFPGPCWFGSGRGTGCRQSLGWVSGLAGSGWPGRSWEAAAAVLTPRVDSSLFCRSSRGICALDPAAGPKRANALPARVWLWPLGAQKRSGSRWSWGEARVPNVFICARTARWLSPLPCSLPRVLNKPCGGGAR